MNEQARLPLGSSRTITVTRSPGATDVVLGIIEAPTSTTDYRAEAAEVFEALRHLPRETRAALYEYIHDAGALFVGSERPSTRVAPPVKGGTRR